MMSFSNVVFLSLMMSNALARLARVGTGLTTSMGKIELELKEKAQLAEALSTETETESKAAIAEILQLQFAEPLPKVLARVHKTAKTMPIAEALHTVKTKLSPEVRSVLLQNATGEDQARSLVKQQTQSSDVYQSGGGLGDLHQSAVFDRAMAFMNNEMKKVREQMDIKLFECGFFKLEKEGLLYETQDILDEIAMDMGLAEAVIEKCSGEIAFLNGEIDTKLGELDVHLRHCRKIREQLEAEKTIIEQDLEVINLIEDTSMKECKMGKYALMAVSACVGANGKTYFETGSDLLQKQAGKLKTTTAQQAFQRVLHDVWPG